MMSNYDKILTSSPINKTAASVVSCHFEKETELSRLINEYQDIQKAITAAKQTPYFSQALLKEWGKRQHEVGHRISDIKSRQRKKAVSRIDYWFVQVCRERMNKFEFSRYLKLATKLRDNKESEGGCENGME